jgi:protein-S-isoprenylcysteine O-methyltransferase Ste14
MNEAAPDHANVVAPPPLIYAGALSAGLLLQRFVPLPFLPRRVARVAGMCLIVLNFLIGVPAVITMRRARTRLDPRHPTTAIVTAGPYRYTRNPIYLSFAMLYTGVAFLANSLWAVLLLPAVLMVMSRGVIAREEQYLERKFGAIYLQYKAQVRRWL